MNLFTRFLTRKSQADDDLTQFVAYWDQLETLVITVFKGKQALSEDIKTYAMLRTALQRDYPDFEQALDPLWRATLVGGALAPEDPFRRLFVHDSAEKFVGDWVAMQNLAAAREALNRLVIMRAS